LAWRPKFLAALSLTRSVILSCRAAHVSKQTAYRHRQADEEFAEQWQEAEADAIELLHARAFQRALEGDCEPIVYMGLTVGWVRKDDSRLQMEMLRAHKPDTFKTAGVNVNIVGREREREKRNGAVEEQRQEQRTNAAGQTQTRSQERTISPR
jgi:hypothetical protein